MTTHRAFRYDVTKMTGPRMDHRGYLVADATLARSGIQEYMMQDGKMRRELRPEDEVTNADSMSTLAGSAVTNNHPPMALDSKNTKNYIVGFLRGAPKKTKGLNDHVMLQDEMTIVDAKTIEDVMTKKKNQVSQGYYADIEMTPGIDPVHGAYDAIQRNIKHNHTAIVEDGRAGPEVAIKMDSADGKACEDFAICYLVDDPEDGGDGDDGEAGDGDFDEDEDDIEIDAKWTSKRKGALPKSSFAYVDPNGKGHLPYKNEKGEVDLPHLRNALARLSQTKIPAAAKAKAKAKLEAVAKKHGVGKEKKDGANQEVVANSIQQGESIMIIFKLDGIEYQLDDKMDSLITKVSGKLKELETLKADQSVALENLKKANDKIESLEKIVNDESEMTKRVQEKIGLIETAKKMFPEETKMDSLSTLELQKKIVKKVQPELDVEKMDSATIRGMAMGIQATFKTDASKNLEGAFGNLERDQPAFKKDAAEGRLKSAYAQAWKNPDVTDSTKFDRGYKNEQ